MINSVFAALTTLSLFTYAPLASATVSAATNADQGVNANEGVTRYLVQMEESDGETCLLLEPAPNASPLTLQMHSQDCKELNAPVVPQGSAAPQGSAKYHVYYKDESMRDWAPLPADGSRVLPVLVPYTADAFRYRAEEGARAGGASGGSAQRPDRAGSDADA